MGFFVIWQVLMVICLLPRSFRAIQQEQVIRGKLDPAWSRYIAELAGPFYDESPPVVQTPKPPVTPKYNWTLSRLGESSFVAVIHRNTTNANSVVSLDAGNACGGVIMTPNQVLTLCACLATWSNWVKNGARPPIAGGSVQSKYDIIAGRIYVTQSMLQFRPDFRTRLDNRKKNLPMSTCPVNVDDSDPRLADVLAVQFVPGIEGSSGGQFMPWPPYPLATDQNVNYVATVLGFGMMSRQQSKTFYNEFGDEIPIENSTVRFQVQQTQYRDCAKNPNVWRTLPAQLSTKVACLGALNRTFELCGGLVGNPVILGGAIHGLTMSNISCEPSNVEMVVLTFDSTIRQNIAIWGGQSLKTRNKDPLSDGEDGKSKEVFYRDFDQLNVKFSHSVTIVTGNTHVIICLLMILPSFDSLVNV